MFYFVTLTDVQLKTWKRTFRPSEKNARMLSSSTHQFLVCRTCPKETVLGSVLVIREPLYLYVR